MYFSFFRVTLAVLCSTAATPSSAHKWELSPGVLGAHTPNTLESTPGSPR